MGILEILQLKDPLQTEKFIAEAPSATWIIRQCIDAKVDHILLEQSKSFKALGMRHIIQSSLSKSNLLDRRTPHQIQKAS